MLFSVPSRVSPSNKWTKYDYTNKRNTFRSTRVIKETDSTITITTITVWFDPNKRTDVRKTHQEIFHVVDEEP
jgi:hypothetical protein